MKPFFGLTCKNWHCQWEASPLLVGLVPIDHPPIQTDPLLQGCVCPLQIPSLITSEAVVGDHLHLKKNNQNTKMYHSFTFYNQDSKLVFPIGVLLSLNVSNMKHDDHVGQAKLREFFFHTKYEDIYYLIKVWKCCYALWSTSVRLQNFHWHIFFQNNTKFAMVFSWICCFW